MRLYFLAAVLGAGARPFAAGFEQGTPAAGEPVDLAKWLKPFLPPGQSKPEKEDLARADARLRRFAARGVFLRTEVDQELWLAWGLPDELPVLARAGDGLAKPLEVGQDSSGTPPDSGRRPSEHSLRRVARCSQIGISCVCFIGGAEARV